MSNLDEFLSALQERTGQKFDATDFDSRLRIQKSVYLLQALGLDVGQTYSFGDYFHGPYSPALARDYYGDDGTPAVETRPVSSLPISNSHLDTLAQAIQHDAGNEFLEATTTLHSVARKNTTEPPETVTSIVQRLKPHLDDALLEEAWQWLAQQGLLQSHTSTRESSSQPSE